MLLQLKLYWFHGHRAATLSQTQHKNCPPYPIVTIRQYQFFIFSVYDDDISVFVNLMVSGLRLLKSCFHRDLQEFKSWTSGVHDQSSHGLVWTLKRMFVFVYVVTRVKTRQSRLYCRVDPGDRYQSHTHAVIKVILRHIRKCAIWQKAQLLKIQPK